jgi:hypothetical protein
MTMRNLVWAALATALLLAGFGVASASDTIRLGGPSAQSTIQGDVDTELVRWRNHGYGGFYRGGYGGFYRGGYGRGYYGGGYYRPYYYSSYYRPYYYSSYYRPYYYGSYYRPYYNSTYYYPIAMDSVSPPVTMLQGNAYYQAPAPQQYGPLMPPINGNGTFQYDGGPRSPIPMPSPDPETNPAKTPRGIIPIDGRLVSMPTQATGGVSVPFTHVPASTSVPRVTYPAYGE